MIYTLILHNNEHMKKYTTELKWAGIFIVVGFVWMIGERAVGLHSTHIDKHAIYTNLFAIPAIAIYVLALLDKRKNELKGSMTYKQGFMTGFIITLIITVLAPVTQWITSTIITPDYFTNAINHAVTSGATTQAEAEAFFSLGSYMLQATIGAFVMGLLTTLVVAAIVKTKPAAKQS